MTREAIPAILTRPSVTTGTRLAMATSKGASFALPTVSANARKVGDAVDARAVVAARQRHALVHVCECFEFTNGYLPYIFLSRKFTRD